MQSEKIMEKKRLCKVKRLHSTPSIISSPPPFLLHKMQKRDNLNNLTKTSQLLAWKKSFNQPSLGKKEEEKEHKQCSVEKTQTGVLNLLKTTYRFKRSKLLYGDLKQTKTRADTLDESGCGGCGATSLML